MYIGKYTFKIQFVAARCNKKNKNYHWRLTLCVNALVHVN